MDGYINTRFLEIPHALSLQLDGPAYTLTVLFKQAALRNYDFNRALEASSALLQEAKVVTPVMCYL